MTSLTRTLLSPLNVADEAVRGIAALPGLAADAAEILRLLSEHLPELTRALLQGLDEMPDTVERRDARLGGLEARLDRQGEELAAARRAIDETRLALAARLETQLEELRSSREAIEGMRADAVRRLDRVSEQLLDLAPTRAAAERLVTDIEKVPGI